MTNETDHEIEPLEFPDHQKAEPAPVLVLTARPRGEAQEAARERAKRWEAGETVPEVINFEEPAQLRALLTERRLQLIEQLLAERPASIRDLAATLDRGVKEVNEDVHLPKVLLPPPVLPCSEGPGSQTRRWTLSERGPTLFRTPLRRPCRAPARA